MSAAGFLRFSYYCWFSRPAGERVLYRAVRRLRPRRIVELGVGDACRAQRLLRAAQRYTGGDVVRYCGVDLFEMRPAESPAIGIKQAYHDLRALGAKVQLAPGDPYAALARIANSLTGTDLLIIAADVDAESLARSWFYVPRMLHERSRVYMETLQGETSAYRLLKRSEIEALAGVHDPRLRRAA